MAFSVRLEGLDKRFGRGGRSVHAVRDLSLEIGEREFFTFVGPSGCGKTTTLRMIAGLETPTAGRIWFGDTDVTALPPQKRDIAMVFQDIALFPYMTVRQNIGYPLRIAGLPRARVDEKVEKVAATLGLSRQARHEARPALRRPAAARGHRPGDHQGAEGAADGRAALGSGRAAAGGDAHRDPAPAPRDLRHHHLCHPRPGRGHDHVHAGGGDGPGAGAADRPAAGDLPAAGGHDGGDLHWDAGDEHYSGDGGDDADRSRDRVARQADSRWRRGTMRPCRG